MVFLRRPLFFLLLFDVPKAVHSAAGPDLRTDPNKYVVDDKQYSISWTDMGAMPINLSDATAIAVGTKIYVIGGCDSLTGNQKISSDFYACMHISNGTLMYDTQTDSWSARSAMPVRRFRHAAAVVGTDIFVVGGRDVNDAIVASVLKYSTTSDSWTTVISNWMGSTSDNAAFAYGQKLYACGGYTENYSIAVSTCSVLDTTSQSPSFADSGKHFVTGRGDFSIVTMDNWAYAIGGFNASWTALSSVERINLASTEGWVALPTGMVHGRGDCAVAVYKGRIVVLGGEDDSDGDTIAAGAALRHVEAYSPSTGGWLGPQQNVPIPYATFRFCGASVGDRIFIFGGQGPLDATCDCYRTKRHVFTYSESVTTLLSGVASTGTMPALLVAMLFSI